MATDFPPIETVPAPSPSEEAIAAATLRSLETQTALAEKQIARLSELMAGTEPLSRAVQEQATAHTRAAASQVSYENAMRRIQSEELRLARINMMATIAANLFADRTTGSTSAVERERIFTASWDDAVRFVTRADAAVPPQTY